MERPCFENKLKIIQSAQYYTRTRLWLSKLDGDISIWWAYSVPLGTIGLRWGPVTMPTDAPVESQFQKDLKFTYLH